MKVLLIGSGGREHALALALAKSPKLTELYIAPGNAGMAGLGQRLDIPVDDIEGLLLFASREQIALTVVGPELPLSLGIVDQFQKARLPIFGPTQAAARLESSKAFAKEVMFSHGVPTAPYFQCQNEAEIVGAMEKLGSPYVIKADGLAAGKGVTVTPDYQTAKEVALSMLSSHKHVVIEGFLAGKELSVLALCDGEKAIPLLAAQDFKRAYDNNEGPNTGGMGAYAPVDWASEALYQDIEKKIFQPIMAAMKARGTPYRGILYAGLMIESKNNSLSPWVIEFNARFGDPETQVIIPLLSVDLLPLLYACAEGTLPQQTGRKEWFTTNTYAVTVTLAAPGYPGTLDTKAQGSPLLLENTLTEDSFLFHAGSKLNAHSQASISGGRILNITGLGSSQSNAQEQAYHLVREVQAKNPLLWCRWDIAGPETSASASALINSA
ncbi:MAG: phosphoribosylamine--glycine ligase [Cyanobacteria bacterium]|nr:phosphoribosylamine--glycine ligase [Cyanobacteriota bacterium]